MLQNDRKEIYPVCFGNKQYRQALVQWQKNIAKQQGDRVLLRNIKLEAGDVTEVRYIIEKGNVKLVDDVSNRRVRELVICCLVVIPICILGYYLSENMGTYNWICFCLYQSDKSH